MPSQRSKSPLAPSSKTHTFLQKSTGESPLIKTTRTSVPVEVRTSQSTNSLSPRSNESINNESDLPGEDSLEYVNHPEDEDNIFDDDKAPEERAAADLRASRRRGYDPNSSLDENDTSFLTGVGSSISSTPSLERAIKKKVQSDSDSDEPLVTMSSTQQVVYRKGQPTATPILIYEDPRREVVQQCIANLMSTFHVYPHSEVIANSFTGRFEDMLRWLYGLMSKAGQSSGPSFSAAKPSKPSKD